MSFLFKRPGRFRLATAIFLIVIAVFQALWMVNYAGLSPRVSITDALLSNTLIYGCFLFAALSFDYYLPPFVRFTAICFQAFIITTVWTLVCKNGLLALFPDDPGYARFWQQSMYIRGLMVWVLICDFCFVNTMIYRMKKEQSSIEKEQQSFQLQKDAELFKLRQQLHPHFLFNSLNSINALIGLEPTKARLMVQQLSDFLRNNLKKDDDDLILFEDEMKDLRLYLAIEQVRFGHRLKVVEHIADGCYPQKIPPFLLQPLVENAVKYGLYGTTEAIEIEIRAALEQEEEHLLRFQISNPFDPEAVSNHGTGFGLASIKRRLYLLFSRNDLLTLHQEQKTQSLNTFTATIHIPIADRL